MRIVASLAALAALAFAQTAAAATVTIAPVTFAPEFQPKLEEKFGSREGPYLQRAVTDIVTDALSRAGAQVGPGGNVTVEVTVNDAAPTRPTMLQLNQVGLDYSRSISTGGADLHAVLRGADGHVITEVNHRYFSPSLNDAIVAGTWSDANHAIHLFAERVAAAYRANAG